MARESARTIMPVCVQSSMVRREERSAMTPPNSENTRAGICCAKPTIPSQNGELVSCRTSQPCATFCIQEPMLETRFPDQKKRNSPWRRARNQPRPGARRKSNGQRETTSPGDSAGGGMAGAWSAIVSREPGTSTRRDCEEIGSSNLPRHPNLSVEHTLLEWTESARKSKRRQSGFGREDAARKARMRTISGRTTVNRRRRFAKINRLFPGLGNHTNHRKTSVTPDTRAALTGGD